MVYDFRRNWSLWEWLLILVGNREGAKVAWSIRRAKRLARQRRKQK